MWILVPIITIVLLIIAVSSMQYILVMIAFVDYIFFYRKENSYGSCVSSFFTYSIYLCATWEDKSLIADNKVETVKAQRETVERKRNGKKKNTRRSRQRKIY